MVDMQRLRSRDITYRTCSLLEHHKFADVETQIDKITSKRTQLSYYILLMHITNSSPLIGINSYWRCRLLWRWNVPRQIAIHVHQHIACVAIWIFSLNVPYRHHHIDLWKSVKQGTICKHHDYGHYAVSAICITNSPSSNEPKMLPIK